MNALTQFSEVACDAWV